MVVVISRGAKILDKIILLIEKQGNVTGKSA